MTTAVLAASAPASRPRLAKVTKWTSMLLVYAFVLGLLLPISTSIYVGPLRLSPYRLILLIAFVPVVWGLISGRAGSLRWADALIVLHIAWSWLALLMVHGGQAIEIGGIYTIETLVPYLLARCYIRTAADFVAFAKLMAMVVILIIPWVAYESFTHHIFHVPVSGRYPEPRWGLARAYGPFEHPIHLGVFCASVLGIVFYALKDRVSDFMRYARSGAIILATFFSLSAGPFTALAAQIGLIGWNTVLRPMRRKWLVLTLAVIAAWIAVSSLSTRSPIHVFISYFTFNVGNAYNRILIWDYGTAEVARHPLFGIGMNDWVRAYWMSASMDNFWLVEAVRYGLPSFLLLVAALVSLMVQAGKASHADPHVRNCRTGWFISMAGIIIAGCTVHYWNATLCLFFFLVGAGAWLRTPSTVTATAPARAGLPRYHKAVRAAAAASK